MSAHRLWTLGEAMAALVSPGTGPAEHANSVRVGCGGAELNVAIGVARLGHDVTWVGALGDDPWGRRIVRDLRAEGVDVRARVVEGAFTGAYLRERRAEGLTRATYLRRGSAGSQLQRADLDQIAFGQGDILHLTALTPVLSDSCYTAWTEAVWRARIAGATVSLDVNYRSAIAQPEQVRTAFNAIAEAVNLVLASPDEAAIVSGEDYSESLTVEDSAAMFRGRLAPDAEVVIKNGPQGSLHVAADGTTTTGAAVPVQVVDLVGAGDAFAAGYLSGLLDSEPPAVRLARGHACAAYVVATDGDWEGAPRRAELEASHTLDGRQVHR